ncbi:MAG: RtcB family protein [Erysipelotrichaceae bacterium]|nr:RtcB family protein [Erysipelotrichaceae bacterium]
MITVKGTHNFAIIYTDTIDETALEQIQTMCSLEFLKDSKIRIMSDVHAGAGCTIGTTMTIHNAIVPNFVGVDIGCGMEVCKIDAETISLEQLDNFIHKYIPSGFDVRHKPHQRANEITLETLYCAKYVKLNHAYQSLGTLGGGNHFIEVNKDSNNNLYIVIHSGSRHLGKQVAEYYQNEAFKHLSKISAIDLKELIQQYKEQGKEKEIQTEIKNRKLLSLSQAKDLAYVSNELMEQYLHDMKIVQEFANLNRKIMMEEIINFLQVQVIDQFTTIHNYIDLENMILRKGAVSAQKNEKLLIPMNMRDGSLLCIGKGNPEWNYSAPHGAGRLLSRKKAFETLSLEEYQKEMQGIYSTCINTLTLDESPMAYKKIDDIVNQIQDTVDIIDTLKPIYNYKAADTPKWKRK